MNLSDPRAVQRTCSRPEDVHQVALVMSSWLACCSNWVRVAGHGSLCMVHRPAGGLLERCSRCLSGENRVRVQRCCWLWLPSAQRAAAARAPGIIARSDCPTAAKLEVWLACRLELRSGCRSLSLCKCPIRLVCCSSGALATCPRAAIRFELVDPLA